MNERFPICHNQDKLVNILIFFIVFSCYNSSDAVPRCKLDKIMQHLTFLSRFKESTHATFCWFTHCCKTVFPGECLHSSFVFLHYTPPSRNDLTVAKCKEFHHYVRKVIRFILLFTQQKFMSHITFWAPAKLDNLVPALVKYSVTLH